MIAMPISSYPMPSDKKSQAQVLLEQKAELTDQAQAVGQSPMDEKDKRQIIGDLDDQISETDREMDHNYTEYSVEQHRRNARFQKGQTKASDGRQARAAAKILATDAQEKRPKLDVTA